MRLLILLFSSVLIAGCATLFSGTSNTISFSSNVDPVRVYVGGLYVGETSLSVDVEKKAGKGQRIRIEKSGYTTQAFNLKNKFDMIAILDISSPVTSGGIDLISGAIKEYSPRHYHIELIKADNMSAVKNTQQLEFVNFVLTHSEAIKQNLAKRGRGIT